MLEYVNALNVELILTATVLQVLMQGHGQGFGMVLECKLGHEGMVHDMKYLAILEVQNEVQRFGEAEGEHEREDEEGQVQGEV